MNPEASTPEASNPEASAVRIARKLRDRAGTRAWSDADARWRRAVRAGDLATADLYRAVCTIIGDRDGVFSQWRAPAATRFGGTAGRASGSADHLGDDPL